MGPSEGFFSLGGHMTLALTMRSFRFLLCRYPKITILSCRCLVSFKRFKKSQIFDIISLGPETSGW